MNEGAGFVTLAEAQAIAEANMDLVALAEAHALAPADLDGVRYTLDTPTLARVAFGNVNAPYCARAMRRRDVAWR